MASEINVLVHALTVNSDGTPRYKAEDIRKTVNVFFPPADGVSGWSCVQGVRATYDGPLCGINGSTVHIREHSGFIYPFKGQSPYAYYLPDTYLQVPNTSLNWKLAIVVVDSTVGHGSEQSAKLKFISYSTPDSNIDGLVLATIVNGTINNVVPRLMTGTTIQVNSADDLQGITAIAGQKATIVSTGESYIRKDGVWQQEDIPLQKVTFHAQDANSFKMGEDAHFLLDQQRKLLHVNLAPFISNVTVAKGFDVYIPDGGLKPSRDLTITGCATVWAGLIYTKTLIWRTSGHVYVGPSFSKGDSVHISPRVIQYPSDITFS